MKTLAPLCIPKNKEGNSQKGSFVDKKRKFNCDLVITLNEILIIINNKIFQWYCVGLFQKIVIPLSRVHCICSKYICYLVSLLWHLIPVNLTYEGLPFRIECKGQIVLCLQADVQGCCLCSWSQISEMYKPLETSTWD